jgi:predicted Zn-ribbon and HTH transcriptional regulator
MVCSLIGQRGTMSRRCPRCTSFDIRRSRTRGTLEAAASVLFISPRRCAACGWRGFGFGGKHAKEGSRVRLEKSAPKVAAVAPVLPPAKGPPAALPVKDGGETTARLSSETERLKEQEKTTRRRSRRRRHKNKIRAAKWQRVRGLVFASLIGLGVFGVVHSCGGAPGVGL